MCSKNTVRPLYSKSGIPPKPDLFINIVNLGRLAAREQQDATAKEIFDFVAQNTTETDLLIDAEYYVLQIDYKKRNRCYCHS